MTRVPMTQAVAADYADAMLVARKAKNVLVLLLLLILLIQLGVFFIVKYVPSVRIRADAAIGASQVADESVSGAATQESKPSEGAAPGRFWAPALEELIAATDFLGVIFSFVLPIILLLVLTIMLVGRLVGVSHVTSAFCISIVFLVFLFPWQSLLNGQAHTAAIVSPLVAPNSPGVWARVQDIPDVRIPGTLYTFPELRRNFDFKNTDIRYAILGWGRFVGFPIVELVLLLVIQARSRRGLRLALGEADVPIDVVATNAV